jgi:hypothetical protein
MHAGCGRKSRDVGAVVHDEFRAGMRSDRHDGDRGFEQPAAGRMLRAKLEKGRSAVETRGRKVDRGPACLSSGVSVDDGV